MVSFDDLIPQSNTKAAPINADMFGVVTDKGLRGLTFGLGNKAQAGLAALVASGINDKGIAKNYELARRTQDRINAAQSEQFPVTSVVSEIGGGVAGGILGAGTKAGAAIANSLRGGGIAARIGKGAVAGSASGAAYGAGTSDYGKSLEGAGQGAFYGALAGGAIPIVGAGLKKAVNYGTDKLARTSATQSGEVLKDSLSKPLQKVYDRLRADYPNQAEFETVLASLGSTKDKALIQAGGKRLENLGKGAAQYPSGEAVSREFFDVATQAAPEKLKGSLAKTISPSTNYSNDVDALLDAGRAKAAPLYSEAFARNQSVQSPVINKILQTPEGKSALGEAVSNMQNEMARVAKPDAELTAMVKELSDIGLMDAQKGGVAQGLKLKTLDYVKRSMDDTVRKAMRTGDEGEVRRITQLKNTLIGEIDNADKAGLYAKARGAAGDYLSTQKAMEDGLAFLKEDAENIPRRLSNMGAAEKQAYRAGVVKTMRNQIDNSYDGANVSRMFSKPATRQKLQSLLAPKDYFKLLDDAKATDEIYKLRNQIVGGSPTAGKQIAAQEFQQAGQEIAIDLATGSPVRAGINAAVRLAKKSIDGLSDKSASEVAELIYTKDPKQKYQIIKQLLNESKKTGGGLRSTEAGQKLKAFYTISDEVGKAKNSLSPTTAAVAGGEESQPMRITITPNDVRRAQQLSFDDLIPAAPVELIAPHSSNQNFFDAVKMAESSGNTNAQSATSSASGLYQFTDQTWKDSVSKWGDKYGITEADKNNPQAQEAMVRELTIDNARILADKIGREPNDGDLYMAHVFGAGAGAKMINNLGQNKIAYMLARPADVKANPSIFFKNKQASQPRTVDEVYALLINKVSS